MPLANNQAIATLHFTNSENSHHCVSTIATVWPNSFSIADYLTTVKSCFGTELASGFPPPFKLNQFSDKWSWTEVSMLGQKTGLLFNGTTAGLGAGTQTQQCPPINVSVKINKKTGIAGRKYRGIMMIPPMHLDEATELDSGGFIDSARVAEITTLFDNAFDQLINNTLTPILIHGDATAATNITSLSCGAQVGTIRKRLRP